MKNKKMNYAISVLLLSFSLTACGSTKNTTQQTSTAQSVSIPESVTIGAGTETTSELQVSDESNTKSSESSEDTETSSTKSTESYDWTRNSNKVEYDIPDDEFWTTKTTEKDVKDETYDDEEKTKAVRSSKYLIQKYDLDLTEKEVGYRYDAAIKYLQDKYKKDISNVTVTSTDDNYTVFNVVVGDSDYSGNITVTDNNGTYSCTDNIDSISSIHEYQDALLKLLTDAEFPVCSVAVNMNGYTKAFTPDDLLQGKINTPHEIVFYMLSKDVEETEHKYEVELIRSYLNENTQDNAWCSVRYTDAEEKDKAMTGSITGQYEFKIGNPDVLYDASGSASTLSENTDN